MSNGSKKTFLICAGEELGVLTDVSFDNFWTFGKFQPLPAYEKYRPLFEALENAWIENDLKETETDFSENSNTAYDIQEQVDILGLEVVYSSGNSCKIRGFKIQNGMFEYKDDRN